MANLLRDTRNPRCAFRSLNGDVFLPRLYLYFQVRELIADLDNAATPSEGVLGRRQLQQENQESTQGDY